MSLFKRVIEGNFTIEDRYKYIEYLREQQNLQPVLRDIKDIAYNERMQLKIDDVFLFMDFAYRKQNIQNQLDADKARIRSSNSQNYLTRNGAGRLDSVLRDRFSPGHEIP
jgi:chaperonin cofactor prefoldin